MVQSAAQARALTLQAAQRATRARIELAIVIPLIVALLILGSRLARDIGRTLAPQLFKRIDPATAGTVGFLIRLAFLVAAMLAAPRGHVTQEYES